ncbi:hypothetical protein BJ741DRAFT_589275 [Chytriomyces cf. hyalinus JEL632]|nr:hypothetical protein BJ741DRAFT_589275 [Chytriomyces cf. hyalinus JEL632]
MSTSDILNLEEVNHVLLARRRTQNGYHYQLRELFFGVILGFVVVFSGISIYLEVTTGCEDSLITGQKLLTVFGKSSGSGIPIISMDQEGLIVVEGVPKEQMYLWLISDEGSCIAHQQIFMREPLLSHDSGLFFGLSQIASTASVNAISAVANACSNMMRYKYCK